MYPFVSSIVETPSEMPYSYRYLDYARYERNWLCWPSEALFWKPQQFAGM